MEMENIKNEIKIEDDNSTDIIIKKEVEIINIDQNIKTEIKIDDSEDIVQNDYCSPKQKQFRIFISNLPYAVDKNELRDLFGKKIGYPVFCQIFTNKYNMSKGTAIIEYGDETLFKKCMTTMQKYKVKGRRIILQNDEDIERDRYGNIKTPNSRESSEEKLSPNNTTGFRPRNQFISPIQFESTIYGNTYGLNEQFLLSLDINGPLINRVIVRNLDIRVSHVKLREVFSIAGKIIYAHVSYDKTGRHCGYGIVQYDHPLEAVQSISMFHNRLLYNKYLFVKLDYGNQQYVPILPEGLSSVGPGLGICGETLHNVSLNIVSNVLTQDAPFPDNLQSRRTRRSFPY